jgi:hypothetical protein
MLAGVFNTQEHILAPHFTFTLLYRIMGLTFALAAIMH